MEQKQPKTWKELILMQNEIWLKEFNNLKNCIDQEITAACLEAAREAKKNLMRLRRFYKKETLKLVLPWLIHTQVIFNF